MARRIVLDTNIYGEIIKQSIEEEVKEKLEMHKNDFLVYGLTPIRKELRDVPRHKLREGRNLRVILLELYDSIIRKEIKITPLAASLAKLYFKEYKRNRGVCTWKEISTDFLIVAQATTGKMDIVVSEDNKSMLSSAALNAYKGVNKQHNLITPHFIGYKEFRDRLL